MGIRIIDVSGTPAEMGLAHGHAARTQLRAFAEDRVALAASAVWSGQGLSKREVLDLAEACVRAHRDYSPALTAELEGMAEASGLGLAELVIVNGFTDFVDAVYGAGRGAAVVRTPGSEPAADAAAPAGAPAPGGLDNCTAFLVPASRTADGAAMLGQTWDMHETAEEHVVVLRGTPVDAPAFVTFTTLGCVGMIGMNEYGVCVGINNLTGGDGQVGVTWPFVVREVLRQRDVGSALRCVQEARLAGAHNYLLMDATGRGLNVEAMSTTAEVTELRAEAVVHTNHCLVPHTERVQRERDAVSQVSSAARLSRGRALLDRDGLTPEDLQAVTRDPDAICHDAEPPKFVATCGAVIMRPGTLEFWAVQGRPDRGPYERIPLPA